MTTALRMKVEDLFRIGEKTIFTGTLESHAKVISGVQCILEVDGQAIGKVHIEGEVHTGKPHRDLWTTSHVNIGREAILGQNVWLISAQS